MAKRRARLRWPWIVGGIFLFCSGIVLVPLLVTGIGRYDLPVRSRQLDAVMAESKRLGLPMTAAELAGPEPPAAENAAPRVREIAMSLPTPPNVIVPNDPKLAAELDDWLKKHSGSLDEISQLMSERPSWYISRDWDMGPMLLFPEFAKYKGVSKSFAGRGFIRAEAGNVDGAIEDFLAGKRLSNNIATEPTIISLLVAIAIDAIMLRTLESYVDVWHNDAKKLRRLEEAVRQSKVLKDPTQAMRCEFYADLNICRNLKLYGGIQALSTLAEGSSSGTPPPTPKPSELQRTGLPRGVFYRASMTPMAETWNEVFAAIEKNGVRNTKWGEITDKRVKAMEKNFKASEVVALIMFPVFVQAERALIRDDVNQDLAIAFVAAHRYRAEHGKWPASLKEIDCEFPDPFNPGKPIQASFSVGAMRVWSVGIDGVDQHGDLPGGSGPKPDDLVFVYPPTARERK